MKRRSLPLLVLLSLLPFPLEAVEIRTIYLAADARARMDIMRVLRKEWPSLRLANRASEADAVLEIRIGMYRPQVPRAVPEPPRTAVVRRTSANGTTSIQFITARTSDGTIEFGQQTAPIGHASGVLRLRGIEEELILYSALPSPFFATQLARELTALRDVPLPNRGESEERSVPIFVRGDARTRIDVARAIADENAPFRIVDREHDADVVLEFGRRIPGSSATAIQTSSTGSARPQTIVSVNGPGGGTRIVAQRSPATDGGGPTARGGPPIGSSAAIARVVATGEETVVHAGLASPFFVRQMVHRLAETLRAR